MNLVLAGLKWFSLLVYFDDICVFVTTQTEHLQRLEVGLVDRLQITNRLVNRLNLLTDYFNRLRFLTGYFNRLANISG